MMPKGMLPECDGLFRALSQPEGRALWLGGGGGKMGSRGMTKTRLHSRAGYFPHTHTHR